jgi:hypothetical protein
MAIVLTSPELVCNAALTRVGWTGGLIANMYDGTVQSNAALAIYGQTRDALLRSFDWGFAEFNAPLTLLKTAPVFGYSPPSTTSSWTTSYPPPPWIYEYQYPADCVKIRTLRSTNPVIPSFDPAPNTYRIADDTSLTSSNTKVVLTNLSAAFAIYTGQVTNPALWDDGFADSLIADLASKLGPLLKEGAQQQQLEMADEMKTQAAAERVIG